MRIEEGKYYRTRGGQKRGPMRSINHGPWKWTDGVTYWTKLGEWSTVMSGHHLDIVAPWLTDTPLGPIVTETVQRIKPGVYGPLEVRAEISIPDCDRPDQPPPREIEAYLTKSCLDASELRELARVALEIAEYLDAQ